MNDITIKPIGVFHCDQQYPQQAPRQGSIRQSAETGTIELYPGRNFEQALTDLSGFDRIWILYWFDRNPLWKPMVRTPRDKSKHGVFATRAPYRPNPIGLSCVRLAGVSGLTLTVGEFDLLDNTPVLDIKPYLPYADSFPEATPGWLKGLPSERFTLEYSGLADRQLEWIIGNADYNLRSFIETQLSENPGDSSRKRVRCLDSEKENYLIAGRTWRVFYRIEYEKLKVIVSSIGSGYSVIELTEREDPYHDKEIHRRFLAEFSPAVNAF